MNIKRLPRDWIDFYEHPVVIAETFVDHHRFKGTCYRAAGFKALGQTRGTVVTPAATTGINTEKHSFLRL